MASGGLDGVGVAELLGPSEGGKEVAEHVELEEVDDLALGVEEVGNALGVVEDVLEDDFCDEDEDEGGDKAEDGADDREKEKEKNAKNEPSMGMIEIG